MEQEKNREAVVTLDELEKSWNDSKSALSALLGEPDAKPVEEKPGEEKPAENLEKAKKEPPEKKDAKDEDEEAAEEESDEDEEDEDEDEEEAKKSLETELSEDPEFAAAMDIEPFLRKFAKSMDKRFASLQGELASTRKTNMALAKALLNVGNQQMLIANTVEAIGNQPVASRSVLKKSGDRFDATRQPEKAADDLNMTPDQILEKSLKLAKEGKMSSRDVSKINTRLNKGMELPEEYKKLLKEEK